MHADVILHQIGPVGETVEIVGGRQHRDEPRRRIAQSEVRPNEQFACGYVAKTQSWIGPYVAGLGQIVDLIPQDDALGVDRLDRPPMPDDIEIVEALIVDVVGFRLARRFVLCRQEIIVVERHIDAEIGLRTQPQFLQ